MTKCLNQEGIEGIAEKILQCKPSECGDVYQNKNEGFPPRVCLWEDGDSRAKGCMVVGLNPGRIRRGSREHLFYRANAKNLSYEKMFLCWRDEKIREHYYYKEVRKFIRNLGMRGPILWSDLAKCQKGEEYPLSLQTIRRCSDKFLKHEMDYVGKDWVLIGVGRNAYNALTYLKAENLLLGIPHPTGSYGTFSDMMEKINKSHSCIEDIKEKIEKGGYPYKALWINDLVRNP